MLIRDVDPAADAAACAAIYAPFVAETSVSFEERPPDAGQMAERMTATLHTHPWVVAELHGAVAGYAYASSHRVRAAYRWAADVGIYVAAERRGSGVGRALYGVLLDLLRRQGIHTACAGITLPNPASVALHRAVGFQPVGVYEQIGYKAGAWHDVSWWQCRLGEPGPEPPSPPGPPLRVDGNGGRDGDQ